LWDGIGPVEELAQDFGSGANAVVNFVLREAGQDQRGAHNSSQEFDFHEYDPFFDGF
jgi:hypothetical protein